MSSFDQTKRENQRFTGVIIPFNCLMSRLVNFLTKNWTDLGTGLHGTLGILSPANIWIGHSKNENRTESEKIKSGGKNRHHHEKENIQRSNVNLMFLSSFLIYLSRTVCFQTMRLLKSLG